MQFSTMTLRVMGFLLPFYLYLFLERPDGAITLARRNYCEIPENLQHVYQHSLVSNGTSDVNNNSSEEDEEDVDDEEDNWSDDWDDQESQIYQNVNVNTSNSYSTPRSTPVKMRGHGNFGLSNPKRGTLRRSSSVMRSGSVRKIKSLTNKFSVFARTGGDAYLMDTENKSSKASEACSAVVVETSLGPQWKQTVRPFKCVIKSPRKDSKYRGIKTFMTYQITTFTHDGDVMGDVRRRYKQFWWLYERLAVKYKFLCVPPLPVRQIVGMD
ncbi:sorting nexin lst-4-like [Anneissia japonica]|uniref:sorting nexin lst-4-like n=1 Tax=Anneissia japonica TaxID=1529436 RepID=UPI001425AF08|nr:sorting nexin lst-4-like [Anneissia japonica]